MLLRAAFGDGGECQRERHCLLPEPTGPQQRWHRAVVHGGRGEYARARADLDELARDPRAGLWRSFAASTRASLLRQLGGHRAAAPLDGRALALTATGMPEDPSSVTAARCDALTGLAADALGCGRFDLARRLLDRVAAELDGVDLEVVETESAEPERSEPGTVDPGEAGDPLWRPRLRLHWVSAETAMASGRPGPALEHAERGVDRAARCPSTRHRIKSDLILAAALCAAGRGEESAELAERVADDCARTGLVPLRWAAAMLLTAVRPTGGFDRVRDDCARAIARGGGVLG
ncbi:hypothetical protein G4X40_02075 [Rhodococcus sp. D2-41]|nr:hypothetical protein [Rhodococcus sp. D2-41]